VARPAWLNSLGALGFLDFLFELVDVVCESVCVRATLLWQREDEKTQSRMCAASRNDRGAVYNTMHGRLRPSTAVEKSNYAKQVDASLFTTQPRTPADK